jgi:8-oxo-dGTP diphosphatase
VRGDPAGPEPAQHAVDGRGSEQADDGRVVEIGPSEDECPAGGEDASDAARAGRALVAHPHDFRAVSGPRQHDRPERQPQVQHAHQKVVYPAVVGEVPQKTIRVVAAVVERDGRYLITQRRPNAVLPLLWEFPGGRREDEETDTDALEREMIERLGVPVDVGQLISFVSHPYEHYTVDLYLYECRLLSEDLTCRAVNAYRWVTSAEFDQYPFTPADEASMTKLLGEA